MNRDQINNWLAEEDSERIASLLRQADSVRNEHCGQEVHLRALLEISNHCQRNCLYCGLRCANQALTRYRMSAEEILAQVSVISATGFNTVVLQAGEDPAHSRTWVADLVSRIKNEFGLAVTLSLGERSAATYACWRDAGADRYLLRFETGDPELYGRIHPHSAGRLNERVELLSLLGGLGYEIGSGIMVGIPGQGLASVASDLMLFKELGLDMIGLGPFIQNPDTPLSVAENLTAGQVESSEKMVLKVLALARLLQPGANIPATTALQSISPTVGRDRALAAGCNVIMPNMTPGHLIGNYRIYPGKPIKVSNPAERFAEMAVELERLNRVPGKGRGDSLNFLRRRKVEKQ